MKSCPKHPEFREGKCYYCEGETMDEIMTEKTCNECGNVYMKAVKPENKLRNQWKSSKKWIDEDVEMIYTSLKDEERIERLLRRCEHLEQRITDRKIEGSSIDFDRMELSALKYVLRELAKARGVCL